MAYNDQAKIDVRNAEAALRDRQAMIFHLAELQLRGILPRRITTRFHGPDPEAQLYIARKRLAALNYN